MKVFSVAEMVAAEKEADAQGNSYEEMMEQAGRGVAEAIIAQYDVRHKRILVLVGPGNNGGDGLVAGHYLAQAGANVVFYLFKPRTAESDANFARLEEQNLPIFTADFDQRFRVLRLRLNGCDFVLDALLGTGVSRPIQGELAQLLRQVRAGLEERAQIMAQEAGLVNESGLTPITAVSPLAHPPRPQVIAVDCPSGLHCDTGELDLLTLPADLTVTFGGPKHGHFLFPGAGACGRLITASIGLNPRHKTVRSVRVRVALRSEVAAKMPPRPVDGHKGTFGRVLVIAGSNQYRGAPVLSARGALRAGAGLVAVATPQVVRHTAVCQLPEATYPPLVATELLDDTAADTLLATLGQYKAILLGPGLDDAEAFLMSFLNHWSQTPEAREMPLVIDADGLNLLARRADWLHLLPPRTVLTPHPGELARLRNQPLSEVLEANRLTLALQCAADWQCVLVLKGAYTVVAAPDARRGSVATVIPFATPVLGTAGSGDVLAGVIVSLLGQGLSPYDAAVVGAFWHGLAGEQLSQAVGHGGALASEIADVLPKTRP